MEAGQRLGELRIYAGDEQIAAIALVAAENVRRLSIWEIALRLLDGVCFGGWERAGARVT